MRRTLNGESKPSHQQAAPQVGTRLPVFGFTLPPIPPDGRVILTEHPIAEIWCPEPLRGVVGAYAMYVYSSSMSPRYEPGEMVWVHPHLPIVQGDYVVVQVSAGFFDDIFLYHDTSNLLRVADEQNSRIGCVRRLVSQSTQDIVLEQLNSQVGQHSTVSVPASMVLALHKVVFSGQG
jgi:phage repressor protein C with HTH and peptisase S24 domain